MNTIVRLGLGLGLAAIAAPASADVITVGPGGDFPQIHAAILSAVDGDVVLVADGVYPGFVIDGVAVSVIADTGATVLIEGPAAVVNLGAGQDVLLAGVEWQLPAFGAVVPQVLNVALDEGSVRLERCIVRGPSVFSGETAGGLRVFGCEDVALVDCIVAAGNPGIPSFTSAGQPGEPGLRVTGSRLSLDGCLVEGGLGNAGVLQVMSDGGPGGAALEATSSTVFLSGCTVTGGTGGVGAGCQASFSIGDGGDGGPGVRGLGGVELRARDSAIAGGDGGPGGFWNPNCILPQDGQPGVPLEGVTVQSVPGLHRVLTLPVPLRESEPFTGSVAAAPGEFAALLWSTSPDHVEVPDLPGQLLVSLGPPVHLRLLGFVPAGGTLDVPTSLPELGPGVESLRLFLQPLVQDAGGALHLGQPITLVGLDAAF